MSNVGQVALIVVGTVVGYFFGAPQLGFVLGSLAGDALFPTQLPPGPQMKSNRTTTMSVGEAVPLLFGTADLAGTVIYLAPVTEYNASTKGGPEQQTFNYNQTIAIGLCERVDDTAPDDVGAIGGISRIWENGTLVYDIRPQLAADSDLGSIAETDQQYANRLAVSAAYAETFTLYLGDELQEADPTIEAVQGVGQAPAFRGLAYIVFPNRVLQEMQGFRHPTFRFECYQYGTGECTDEPQASNEQLYPWFDGRNVYTYQLAWLPNGTGSAPYDILYDNLPAAQAAGQAYTGFAQTHYIGYNVNPVFDAPAATLVPMSGSVAIAPPTVDPSQIVLAYNFTTPTARMQPDQPEPSDNPASLYAIPGALWWQPTAGVSTGIVYTTDTPSSSDPGAYPPWDPPFQNGSRWSDYYWFETVVDTQIYQNRKPGAPNAPCYELTISPLFPGFALNGAGNLVQCSPWTYDTTRTYKVLQQFAARTYNTQHPLNPCLAITDPASDDEAMWTAAYDAAVTESLMAPGMTYSATGTGGPGTYPVAQNWAYIVDLVICTGQGGLASLAEVITLTCKRAGLTAIDVTDLEGINVPGYSVSSICSATQVLTPLRSIGFFDSVESSGVMRFQARGKPIVATLSTDDIGAYDASSAQNDGSSKSSIPPSVSTVRAQDEDLPRMIRFKYKAVARDYEDGEQDSPFRLATAAVNDTDVESPICLGDVQAAKCAEVLWAESWAGRTSYGIAIDQSWPQLEVGDCIGVPVDGVIQRMRIVKETTASGVLRKLACVSDDDGAYISYAVASVPMQLPSTLSFIPTTTYQLLDLPCLSETDNDPGFYVACEPSVYGGKYSGCVIYKSIDGGDTYAQALALTKATPMGTITAAVLASEPYTWDDTTVIEVRVADSSITFESRTDDALLAGANAASLGADGRWEIVQFANATLISANLWQLSRLLRGRRGTEHVMGSSRLGDQFIMVSTGTIGRIVLASTEIGASRMYNAVSIGAGYVVKDEQTFTGHGEALVCFSPENPAAQYDTAGNVVISWIRRSRLGQTLMSGVDIPLGEATEAFSIDILEQHSPASPEIVHRTLTSSGTSVIYPRADFEADSGSPLPTTIKVAIYQLSAITGRGTPQIAVLTIEGV